MQNLSLFINNTKHKNSETVIWEHLYSRKPLLSSMIITRELATNLDKAITKLKKAGKWKKFQQEFEQL